LIPAARADHGASERIYTLNSTLNSQKEGDMRASIGCGGSGRLGGFGRLLGIVWIGLALGPVLLPAQNQTRGTLNIYVIDVEGGNATLFVSPGGQSLLMDTGYGGAAGARDAERIAAAAKDAGLQQIDHLITTHWHGDHYGGMEELASRVPIREFIDHGPNVQPAAAPDEFLARVYPALTSKAKRRVVKPGDRIELSGLDVRVVTSAGETLRTPLVGAGGPNPFCANFRPGQNNAEDPQSVGIHVAFGKFRTMHLGDLTRNKEFELMCPNNPIGTVDVFLGLHHGQASSNSEVIVHALRPRVAIMNNGTRKGGEPDVMRTVFSSPGLEDLWQMHFSLFSGQEYTVPGMFIANLIDEQQPTMPRDPLMIPQGSEPPPAPVHNGPAHWIKVSAQSDGTFTVTNSRNGFSKTYRAGGN
jgi:beta-lactamase superfamily II metal-dependent hydrolase